MNISSEPAVSSCAQILYVPDDSVDLFIDNNHQNCRDLGVTVSADLTPSVHVNNIVIKGHQRANAIHRCFVSRDINLLMRAYLVYVRPILEYNSMVIVSEA